MSPQDENVVESVDRQREVYDDAARYVDLGDTNIESGLYDVVLCKNVHVLNDNDSDSDPFEQQAVVADFLATRFPVRSTFER